MKKDIINYVSKCLEWQRVKIEHVRPDGMLLPHAVPPTKWQTINMDFVVGLPRMRFHHDSIFVVVEKLTKVAHFIPKNTIDDTITIVRKFIREIFRLHGMSAVIISDRYSKFTSKF